MASFLRDDAASPPDPSSDPPHSAGDAATPADRRVLTVTSKRRVGGRGGTRHPLFLCRVEAGFPSPADDYVESSLDLSEELIDNPTATFFVRVSGHSMSKAGIHDGDTLIVDRSVEPKDGSVVVAALDGELTVKRYQMCDGRPSLMPESDAHEPIPIRDGQELVVWGVVKSVIHDVS